MLLFEQKELLCDKTYNLLGNEGYKVENEQIVQAMLKKGCKETASGRIQIPRELIEKFVCYQKQTQEQDARDQELMWHCGPDWAHRVNYARMETHLSGYNELHDKHFQGIHDDLFVKTLLMDAWRVQFG